MRAFLIGSGGAVLVLVIVSLVYLAWDTHRMAVRGDAAASFIERQLQAAQEAAQRPAAP